MCISDVSHWMATNRLKVNVSKTQLLWAGSTYGSASLTGSGQPSLPYSSEMRPSQPAITCASSLSPSRLTLASTSTFQTQVHRAFTAWLRQIRRIRRSLIDTESAKTLVHAFVSSRVDGCNSMLAGSSWRPLY